MGFRANFLLRLLGNLLSFGINIIFFQLIYLNVSTIGGWQLYETLILVGSCQIVNYLHSAFFGGISRFSDYVEEGTLDLILLKPVDPQFLISTRYINYQSLLSLVFPLALIVYVMGWQGITLSFLHLILYLLLLICGLLIRYALGFLIMSSSLWVVRADALYALYDYIASLAQYPLSIYPAVVKVIFTFLIPIIIIANFPALSLLGELDPRFILLSLLVSSFFFFLARGMFLFSLRFYTSASS